MTAEQIKQFMNRHGLSYAAFSKIVGVTPAATNHWLAGRRVPSLTVSRMCRLLDNHPELMQELLQ